MKNIVIFAGGVVVGAMVYKAYAIRTLHKCVETKGYEKEPASSDIVFDSRETAEKILDAMDTILKHRGNVNVADMYHVAGLRAEYALNEYGWVSLKDACFVETPNGYCISLPAPIELR